MYSPSLSVQSRVGENVYGGFDGEYVGVVVVGLELGESVLIASVGNQVGLFERNRQRIIRCVFVETCDMILCLFHKKTYDTPLT